MQTLASWLVHFHSATWQTPSYLPTPPFSWLYLPRSVFFQGTACSIIIILWWLEAKRWNRKFSSVSGNYITVLRAMKAFNGKYIHSSLLCHYRQQIKPRLKFLPSSSLAHSLALIDVGNLGGPKPLSGVGVTLCSAQCWHFLIECLWDVSWKYVSRCFCWFWHQIFHLRLFRLIGNCGNNLLSGTVLVRLVWVQHTQSQHYQHWNYWLALTDTEC